MNAAKITAKDYAELLADWGKASREALEASRLKEQVKRLQEEADQLPRMRAREDKSRETILELQAQLSCAIRARDEATAKIDQMQRFIDDGFLSMNAAADRIAASVVIGEPVTGSAVVYILRKAAKELHNMSTMKPTP